MEPITQMIIYLLIGLFAGFMSGMFGIGGGSIRIPLLYAAGLPLLSAFGINFLVIPFASFVGALTQRRNIAKEIVIYAIIGGVLGEVIGAYSVGFIPTLILAIIFVTLCFIVAFGIHSGKIVPKLTQKIKPTKKNIFGSSFFVSFITGLRGGSGGQIFPALLKSLGLDTHKAIATSLTVSIFTAFGAIPIYWHRGDIIWLPAFYVLIGSMAGAWIGSLMSLKTKPIWLEVGLSVFIVILAFVVLIKTI
ncbi:MAG: sulfite exporter TauE/SafE family protein [Methanosarcinaceae archaeon]|nr:sulfite exporter TauE/SafE family protein [Methanosarcinaceae archaeon]